jgi:hypothetical protein
VLDGLSTMKTEYSQTEIIPDRPQTLIRRGLAMAQVRDQRLYRAECDTFQEYCRLKWDCGRQSVNRIIRAAKLYSDLGCSTWLHQPKTEPQLRPLIGLVPEHARAAWELAVALAGGSRVTGRDVTLAIEVLHFRAPAKRTKRVCRIGNS